MNRDGNITERDITEHDAGGRVISRGVRIAVCALAAGLTLAACGTSPNTVSRDTTLTTTEATTVESTTETTTTTATTTPAVAPPPINQLTAPPVPRPPAPKATTKAPTKAPAARKPEGNCDPSYPGVCIKPAPPDLDCGDVPHKRFRVVGADPHRFDNDGDGIACEK